MTPRLAWALGLFLLIVVIQRAAELALSARNAARLRERGARQVGRDGFGFLALVHALFVVSLAAEVLWLGARPTPLWPLWLVLWIGAQALRYAAIQALGDRWNVRVLVVPGEPLIDRGPYRFLRHPNYVAVVVELAAAPLLFGAWRTALGISALNLVALWGRLRAEEQGLRGLLERDRELRRH